MILGINPSHDAAFCLLDQRGNPVFFIEEERFNRTKHTGFNTLISLDEVIRRGLIDPQSVTDLVYSFEMGEPAITDLMSKCNENVVNSFGFDVFERASQYFHQPEHQFSFVHGVGLTTEFDEVKRQLSGLFPKAKETSYMHHLCHAASAFYPSPFHSAALIIIDGSGRLETTTIWRADSSGCELLYQNELPHSIGILYWLFSQYIGLEEGQTMGLAAYGMPLYRELIYERILKINGQGKFSFKAPIVSWFDMDREYAIRIIENIFGRPGRSGNRESLNQFHADVAASIQAVTEELLISIARYAKQITGQENLCMAGGVIQNCVANGHLVNKKIFTNVWIQPVANDAGTALGAALHHHHTNQRAPSTYRWKMTTAQLGLDVLNEDIKNCLRKLEIPFKEIRSHAAVAAQQLADGRVIGWFQGKAEVGPRALGGRSILADARNSFNSFVVNEIKRREPWRPFAPSVLAERLNDIFIAYCDSPYMILSFHLKKSFQRRIPAISHINESARVQTVTADFNGPYHDLLKAFQDLTGCPVILNTSFNLKEEPIVQHPLEAVRDFLLSGIDTLFLGNCVIAEKPQMTSQLREALSLCKFIALYDTRLRASEPVCLLKHESFTSRQQRLFVHFKTLLTWLKIAFVEVPSHEIRLYLSSELAPSHFISIAHLQDEQLLNELPVSVHERITISVLDNQMFPTQSSLKDFFLLVGINRRKLQALIKGRKVFVWCSDDSERNEILSSLQHINVQISGVISDHTPFQLIDSDLKILSPGMLKESGDSRFLILSYSIMDRHKSVLRNLGYHTGRNYVVWES